MTTSNNSYAGIAKASFKVGQTGRPNYKVAIKVPPGTGKMQPKLSISYLGGQTNGLLGIGYKLNGISSIERVGQTFATDGSWTSVNFTYSDRFKLSGERLISVSDGQYGGNGVEYRTERETWMKIVSNGDVGGGPESFTVLTKSGKTMQYGLSSNSRIMATGKNVVRVWALEQVSDACGNTMTINYAQDLENGSYRPVSIDYTSNTVATPVLNNCRQVAFDYEQREDPIVKYIGGVRISQNYRMISISTFVNSNIILQYKFDYQYSELTNRSQLIEIKKADNLDKSLPPLNLDWIPEESELLNQITTIGKFTGIPEDYAMSLTGDITGNGCTDLIQFWSNSNNQLSYALFKANQNGFGPPLIGTIPCQFYGATPGLTTADINGNGRSDIVYFYAKNQELLYATLTWNGADFDQNLDINLQLPSELADSIPPIIPLDMAGNGKDDLMIPFSSNYLLNYYILLSDGTKFIPQQVQKTQLSFPNNAPNKLVPANLTGNPQSDMVYANWNGDTNEMEFFSLISNGNIFQIKKTASIPMTGSGHSSRIVPIDTTGDGLTDIAFIWHDEGENYQLQVLVADGTQIRLPVIQQDIIELPSNIGMLAGLNLSPGTGSDLLFSWMDQNNNLNLTPLIVENEVISMAPNISLGLKINFNKIISVDIKGTGKSDIIIPEFNKITNEFIINTLFANNATAALVSAIRNNIGGEIKLQYSSLTDTEIYSEKLDVNILGALARASAPNGMSVQIGQGSVISSIGSRSYRREFDGPLYVVSRYNRIAGNGLIYTHKRKYANGILSTSGRGWLGFESVTHINEDTKSAVVTTYRQEFPLTGAVSKKQWFWQNNPEVLRTLSKNYSIAHPPISTNVYLKLLVEINNIVHAKAPANMATYQKKFSYDTYGNIVQMAYTDSQPLGGSKTFFTNRTYINNRDMWIIGQLQSTIQSSDLAGTKILRWLQFDYCPDNRKLKQKTVHNYLNTTQNLVNNYEYDAFGNCQKVTTNSGHITLITFDDTTKTFAISRTRMTGADSSLIDKFSNDLGSGKLLTHTDPNNNLYSREYDGLGRLKTVKGPAPNGDTVIFKKISRSLLQGYGYICEIHKLQNWDASVWRILKKSYDGMKRCFQTQKTTIGDIISPKAITIGYKHDSKWRLIGKTLPYFEDDSILWKTKTFDPLSRIITSTIPLNTSTNLISTMAYDGIQKITERGNENGPFTKTTVIRCFFNAKMKLVQRINELGKTSNFSYDPLGRILKAVPPSNNAQNVGYDGVGAANLVAGSEFGKVNIERDYTSRILTQNYANGNVVVKGHDILGRVTSINFSDGSSYSLVHDGSTEQNLMGRLASVTYKSETNTEIFTKKYGYDPYGRITTIELTINGKTESQVITYTPSGLKKKNQFPDGSSVEYNFNGLGQILNFEFKSNPQAARQTLSTYEQFNAFNKPGKVVHANDTITSLDYTPYGRLSSLIVANKNSEDIYKLLLGRNDFGNVETVTSLLSESPASSYTYDLAAQLESETKPETGTNEFFYDSDGNITQINDTKINYQNNNLEVNTGKPNAYIVEHDQAGNRKQVILTANSEVTQYTYNSANKLTSVTNHNGKTEFLYDHKGVRVHKRANNSATKLYVSKSYVIETDASSRRTQTKLIHDPYGLTAIVRTSDNEDKILFIEKDQVGSTTLVTGSSGNVESTISYDPFGNPKSLLNNGLLLPSFGGKEFDQETDLYYFKARYYDPSIGRFITADSKLGSHIGQTNALNRFAFVLNNPINHGDPSGHGLFEWLFTFIVDALEIIAGIVLSIFGFSRAGGALIGAGVAGAIYDVTALVHHQKFSWLAWGISEGVGALMGLIGVDVDDGAGGIGDGGGDGGDGGGDDSDSNSSSSSEDEDSEGEGDNGEDDDDAEEGDSEDEDDNPEHRGDDSEEYSTDDYSSEMSQEWHLDDWSREYYYDDDPEFPDGNFPKTPDPGEAFNFDLDDDHQID